MANEKLTNLVAETKKDLQEAGYYPSDVRWVGTSDGEYSISWAEFAERFSDVDYPADSHSKLYINRNLVVVGEDWWLERAEYDNQEWWKFNTLPTLHVAPEPLTEVLEWPPPVPPAKRGGGTSWGDTSE